MKKFSFCFFLFLAVVSIGQQENYRFSHVNVEDGLSHPDILSILEDSRGFLWIGTPDGLNKYNGFDIKVYKPTQDGTNSICHQSVKSIVEDKNGNLWFGTDAGLSLYKPKEDRFYNFTAVGDCENCLAGRVIRTMLLDSDRIWLGTNAGLSVIDINTQKIRSWWYDENTDVVEVLFAIREIIPVDNNRLLMATDEGLVLYDIDQDKFKYFDEDDGLENRGLGCVFQSSKGKYWLASDKDGVYQIEGEIESPTFVHHPELIPGGAGKTTVYNFVERENGELWIATHLGLTILDQHSGKISYHLHSVDNKNTLSTSTVEKLMIDSQNRVWLGTPAGLNVFDPYYNQFEFLTHQKGNPNSIVGTSVAAVFEDSRGFIWIGTADAGITIIEKTSSGEKYYHMQKGNRSTDLRGNEIYAIEEDKEGKIWVSIPDGLHVIDWPDRTKFEYTIEIVETGSIKDNKLPVPYIYQFYNDDQNKMWVATHGEGLISIDKNSNYRQYKYIDQNPLITSVDYIITVAEDDEGRIWLGNFNLCGGIIDDPKIDNSYKRIKGDSVLFGKNINDFLFIDKEVVISTSSGVFYFENRDELLNSKRPEFMRYTESYGMSKDFSNVLIPQNKNLIWISTNDGISLLDIKTRQVKSYKNVLSAADRHFNHNSGVMTTDSIIYFGSTSGAVRFNPYTIKENDERPKVYFRNFKILNEEVLIASDFRNDQSSILVETSYLKEIELNSNDKIFSLEIEVIDFRIDAKPILQYKLEGFDDDWQYTTNPLITRSNLDAGTYTLRARVSNSDDLWSDEAVLSIKVKGPWWKQTWAFLLYGLGLIGIFQLLVYMKLQRERLVTKIKNDERENFRQESSKDFHDEAGTKITRISLLTEILKKKVGSNEEAERIISKIDQNLKELNMGMRDFIWSLNIENDNLLDTILRFTEFAHLFCEEANIQFKTQSINPNVKNVKLEISQRRHILLILKEALNNSVKHGAPTEIELDCTLYSNKFKIELKDNGQGFDPKSITNGNGLGNIKFRAKEIGADVRITSQPNSGSAIVLELPFSEDS